MELSRKGRTTRLTDLDVSLHAKEHIVTLDITVDNLLGMQVCESLEGLLAHAGNLALGHDVVCHNIRERTALHVVHDHPEVTNVQIAVDVVDNVRVASLSHDQNFIDDELLLRLLLQVHLLHGHNLTFGVGGGEHTSGGTG